MVAFFQEKKASPPSLHIGQQTIRPGSQADGWEGEFCVLTIDETGLNVAVMLFCHFN